MTFLLKSIREKQGIRRYIGPKRVIFLVALAAFFYWAWNSYHAGSLSAGIIEQYRAQHPATAVLLFVLIYAVSVIASVPSLPLNLSAGFFWGGFLGGIYATLGMTLGGLISFIAARRLAGQPLTGKFDNNLISKVQAEFDAKSWKFVAFARINPIIPNGPLNYILGLTSLSTRDFLWTTFVFLLPPAVATAYIGDAFQTAVAKGARVEQLTHGILVASAAVTLLAALKFTLRILKKP